MDGWIPIYIIACRRQVVAFAPKVIKCAAYGVAQGRGWRYGQMGGQRERARGGCGFSSLVKQKIKGKNYAVFCFAGKRIFFYICDVITSLEKEKSSANHYSLVVWQFDNHAAPCQFMM